MQLFINTLFIQSVGEYASLPCTVTGHEWIKSSQKCFIKQKYSIWNLAKSRLAGESCSSPSSVCRAIYRCRLPHMTIAKTALIYTIMHLSSYHWHWVGENCSDFSTWFLTVKNKDSWCHKSTIKVYRKKSLLCCVYVVHTCIDFSSTLVYIRHKADTAWRTCCLLVFVLTCFLVQFAGYRGRPGVSSTALC